MLLLNNKETKRKSAQKHSRKKKIVKNFTIEQKTKNSDKTNSYKRPAGKAT